MSRPSFLLCITSAAYWTTMVAIRFPSLAYLLVQWLLYVSDLYWTVFNLFMDILCLSILMPLRTDSVGEGILFLGCLSGTFVCSFVCLFIRSSGQILLPSQYLMNNLNNFDRTDREYSLALVMTWLDSGGQRSRLQQPSRWHPRRCCQCCDVEVHLLVLFMHSPSIRCFLGVSNPPLQQTTSELWWLSGG